MATSTVRKLLAPTSLPDDLVDEFLSASPVWLMGQPPAQLAGALVLCHPPLASCEVRAVARPTASPTVWALTIAAHDRPGLLADVAGILADQALSVVSAAATMLAGPGIALQQLTVVQVDERPMTTDHWDALGLRLQAVLGRQEPAPRPVFTPSPPVTVAAHPQELGRALVTVEAPDRVGLLWAVASWFSDHGCNVEAFQADSEDGMVTDSFLVAGHCEWTDLAETISGAPVKTAPMLPPLRLALQGVTIAATVIGAVAAGAARVAGALRRST